MNAPALAEVKMAQVFDAPINTTDQNLDRVLAAGLPVALVFLDGATGLDESLKRLAADNVGQLLVVKVKADENPQSVRRFQVRSLPAVVTVRRGETVSQAEAVSDADLKRHVDYLLGRGPRPEPAGPAPSARPAEPARPAPAERPADSTPAGTTGRAGTPLIVTDATFEEQVLRSPEPVLIDFWAPWCGPCRMVAPTVERLAGEMAGRLRVVKVNTDENRGLMQRFGIQGIPTMMIFKNGQLADRWTGALPEPAIRQHLRQTLGL
jgi:thioredoxin 1